MSRRVSNADFLVLGSCARKSGSDFSRSLLPRPGLAPGLRAAFPRRVQGFALRAFEANQPIAFPPSLREAALSWLRASFPGAKIVSSGSDLELCLSRRHEGLDLCLLKLPREEEAVAKGELHPPLARIMCLLAGLGPQDNFLDPCAGYGSILKARVGLGPFRKAMALDINAAMVEGLRNRFRAHPRRQCIFVGQADALSLEGLRAGEIDRLVSDPPWGLWEDIPDLGGFYRDLLSTASRVLAIRGKAVILSAVKTEMEAAIEASPLCTLDRYDILVSGKKAGLWLLGKRPFDSGPA